MWVEELGIFFLKGNIFKVSENVFLITYKSKRKENTRRLKKNEP
jgi:hypothetical protein